MFKWSSQLRERIRMEAYMYGLKTKSEHRDVTCAGMRGIAAHSAMRDG